MYGRILSLVLVMLLALPLALASPLTDAKPKKKIVTRVFTNAGAITMSNVGVVNPYPATIQVSGLKKGKILDVNVLLNNYNNAVPDDTDVLLAASQLPGANAIIMSDVGAAIPAVNVNLKLDDQATLPLPDAGPLVSGTFLPTNAAGLADNFPPPAPPPSGNSALSVFNGGNPNGTWQLFVSETFGNGSASFTGGWSLEITAKVKKGGKHKK